MLAIADVAVTVKDARASARWWQEKLGFGVHVVGDGAGHGVMVAAPGERFVLHLCEGIEPVEPGNTGIAFMTDEIEPLVRRMEEAGVRFPEPLTVHDWGGSAKFADPDGNVFWLLGASRAFINSELRQRAPPRRARPPKRRPRTTRPRRP